MSLLRQACLLKTCSQVASSLWVSDPFGPTCPAVASPLTCWSASGSHRELLWPSIAGDTPFPCQEQHSKKELLEESFGVSFSMTIVCLISLSCFLVRSAIFIFLFHFLVSLIYHFLWDLYFPMVTSLFLESLAMFPPMAASFSFSSSSLPYSSPRVTWTRSQELDTLKGLWNVFISFRIGRNCEFLGHIKCVNKQFNIFIIIETESSNVIVTMLFLWTKQHPAHKSHNVVPSSPTTKPTNTVTLLLQ